MNPEDLAAAATPEVIQAVARLEMLRKAKRKNKPGPGGSLPVKVPAKRRMNTEEVSESSSLQDFLQMFSGGTQ